MSSKSVVPTENLNCKPKSKFCKSSPVAQINGRFGPKVLLFEIHYQVPIFNLGRGSLFETFSRIALLFQMFDTDPGTAWIHVTDRNLCFGKAEGGIDACQVKKCFACEVSFCPRIKISNLLFRISTHVMVSLHIVDQVQGQQ